jgi:adenosylhomocysteine nucleosidase
MMPVYQEFLYPLGRGVTALVVMATEHECGAHLKQLGIKPLITGVGPVQAAIELTHALVQLIDAQPSRRPDVIINLGSAGSATLEQGAVYRVARSHYRDMDASAFGFARGQTPFSPHPGTVEAAPIMPDFPCASCSSGANVVSDHGITGADLADMEYSALNEVAMRFGIALIGFKGISDGKKPLTGELVQWTELLPVIDRNLAVAIASLKTRIAQGEINKDDLTQMPSHWRPEHATFGRQASRSTTGHRSSGDR